MKRYLINIMILSILVLTGCDDILDKNPPDKISPQIFWQSKSDFDMALTANYGKMHGEGGPWDTPALGMWAVQLPNWDNLTDNSYGQHNYGKSLSIVSGNVSSTTQGYILGVYTFCYEAIARINIFLQEQDKYEGSDYSQAEKDKAAGEVRFLRAFYYFQLYSLY